MSLVQLALVMEMVWRRPGVRDEQYKLVGWSLSVAFVVLLLLRIVGAFPLFWLGALLLGVFGLMRLISAIALHLQRPIDAPLDAPVVPSIAAVAAVRGLRVLLLIVAVLLLARNVGIDLVQLLTGDTAGIRILRGVFSVTVIALVADLVWFVLKAMIERRLAEAQGSGPGGADPGQTTRIRTVLPILRNVVFVTLAVTAVLMALSALGVDIAPMVAGAGVVGIAVGFGAQTLVKDIVSGVFFLFDDAFRVGEYIQSGSYKGTVESFSLRSVRLRHHRGPVYTVPFGELGAVQNMSRDWVIDKLSIGITYDSDLEKARKLIKKIGQDLAADPEMGPNILEPLKMQGVEQFGDFAIQIRMKMMTRPGEQFVVRRKAFAAIKTAFDANGIKFAFPDGAGGRRRRCGRGGRRAEHARGGQGACLTGSRSRPCTLLRSPPTASGIPSRTLHAIGAPTRGVGCRASGCSRRVSTAAACPPASQAYALGLDVLQKNAAGHRRSRATWRRAGPAPAAPDQPGRVCSGAGSTSWPPTRRWPSAGCSSGRTISAWPRRAPPWQRWSGRMNTRRCARTPSAALPICCVPPRCTRPCCCTWTTRSRSGPLARRPAPRPRPEREPGARTARAAHAGCATAATRRATSRRQPGC
jgi:small-conductance mechanosensitive channel